MRKKNLTPLFAAAILCVTAAAAAAAQGAQICDLVITDCASNDSAKTLVVPSRAIYLSPKMPSCADSVQVPTLAHAPSVVFLIDNSLSISSYNDPDQQRFKAASVAMGLLNEAAPDAEVSLVVFNSSLVFDYRDNNFFKAAFPKVPEHAFDSYVPLTPLNKVFKDGRSGLDTLRGFLATTPDGKLVHQTKRRSGILTDFLLAFQAAKVAFEGSKTPKGLQFIILVTDGEPQDTNEGDAVVEFLKGKDIATTFALYIKPGNNNQPLPGLKLFISNIAKNGYSASNPRSSIYSLDGAPEDYRPLLEASVVDNITNVPAVPNAATLTVTGKTYESTSSDGKNFLFGTKRIPLERGSTLVGSGLKYSVEYLDSTGKKTKDTTVSRRYNVVRSETTPNAPPGTSLLCREQADIALFHQGNRLTTVRSRNKLLEVRLTPLQGETCLDCKTNLGSVVAKDSEALVLNPKGSFFSAEIPRESLAVVPGDRKWQNAELDSLVVIYVNAENPLDSIRKTFPYENRPSILGIMRHGDIARVTGSPESGEPMQWLVVGAGDLQVTPLGGGSCCRSVPGPLGWQDSLHYIGVTISASRALQVQARIFSILGEVVSTVSFSVSDRELLKLPPGFEPNTRLLKVLWNNRDLTGGLAGTGAYVLKVKVNIIPDPDEPNPVIRAHTSRVGVLR